MWCALARWQKYGFVHLSLPSFKLKALFFSATLECRIPICHPGYIGKVEYLHRLDKTFYISLNGRHFHVPHFVVSLKVDILTSDSLAGDVLEVNIVSKRLHRYMSPGYCSSTYVLPTLSPFSEPKLRGRAVRLPSKYKSVAVNSYWLRPRSIVSIRVLKINV
jgi:hypothetical protein